MDKEIGNIILNEIAKLHKRFDVIEKEVAHIAPMRKDIVSMQETIGSMQETIGSMQKDISALQEPVSHIDSMRHDISILKKSVLYLENDLTTKVNLILENQFFNQKDHELYSKKLTKLDILENTVEVHSILLEDLRKSKTS